MRNIVLLAICLAFVSCKPDVETVHLKGELKNFPSEFMMTKNTPVGMLLKEGVKIVLDEQNKFDLTFDLDKPTYYRLGRNTLYISPGDQIELFCDMNAPKSAKFSGDASLACEYLKSKPFPKGGSYLYGYQVLDGNPEKDVVRKRIEDVVLARQTELNALKNVSAKFKKIEHGRILFDAANSLMSYSFYGAYMAKIPRDSMKKFGEESAEFFKEDIDKYCANGGDADYLSIDTYLSVVERCAGIVGEENMDQEILDFLNAYELTMNLGSSGPVASVLNDKDKCLAKIKTQVYIDAINKSFKKYDLIMPGMSAPELNMKNRAGEAVKISDFKGKFVVIDVWATWCGPCIKESPYFEKLAGKYKGNENIKFVAISIDSDLKAWEKYLAKHEKLSEQFVCNRTEFEKYILQGVPRFMIIGKKGEIIDVFAPTPSNPKLEEMIIQQIG